MKKLPGAAQMKAADRYTIQTLGVPSLTLMERAAEACVRCMEEEHMDLSHICIVCGSGNNGGDGFAIGRMLLKKGHNVTLVFVGNPEHCTEECAKQMEMYEDAGGVVGNEYPEDEYSIIVDAVFGVGLSRTVEGRYAVLFEKMNRTEGVKFAVDIPSGISADTGQVLGTAFRADITVTFQAEKLGIMFYPGKEYAGKVVVPDIGISMEYLDKDSDVAYAKEWWEYADMLPVRKEDSNKGTHGKLLVIAGSKGMSGAAYFNARSAYLAGAGLVQIYTADENRLILQQLLPEAIITTYDFFDEGEVLRLLRWADAVCIGSGIGTGDKSKKILKTVLENAEVPVVIDADGLNLMSEHIKYFQKMQHHNYILTPHMKEMARLTGAEVPFIQNNRMKILKEFTVEHNLTCVLKDSRTVIQTAMQKPCVNTTGNCAMAKAGSGDVLAGIIAGLVVQGMACQEAAILGVYLHGRTGDKAREEKGSYSVLAEDLMRYISTVMKEVEKRYVEEL